MTDLVEKPDYWFSHAKDQIMKDMSVSKTSSL